MEVCVCVLGGFVFFSPQKGKNWGEGRGGGERKG